MSMGWGIEIDYVLYIRRRGSRGRARAAYQGCTKPALAPSWGVRVAYLAVGGTHRRLGCTAAGEGA